MQNNHLTDEEKPVDNKNMVLQKNATNSLGQRVSKKETLKEMVRK